MGIESLYFVLYPVSGIGTREKTKKKVDIYFCFIKGEAIADLFFNSGKYTVFNLFLS